MGEGVKVPFIYETFCDGEMALQQHNMTKLCKKRMLKLFHLRRQLSVNERLFLGVSWLIPTRIDGREIGSQLKCRNESKSLDKKKETPVMEEK